MFDKVLLFSMCLRVNVMIKRVLRSMVIVVFGYKVFLFKFFSFFFLFFVKYVKLGIDMLSVLLVVFSFVVLNFCFT